MGSEGRRPGTQLGGPTAWEPGQGLAVREGGQGTASLDLGNESHGGRGVLVYGSVGAWTPIFSFPLCVSLVAFLLQFRLGLRFIGDLRQHLRR